MEINDIIWYDLVNAKYGDEYLIVYIQKQRNIRKWFKILTILFSASGIFSAFQSLKIPTIISCIFIGIVQLATLIEGWIIHSEKEIDELCALRLLYYNRTNRLEKLFHSVFNEEISSSEGASKFFKLRNQSKQIEELDNKVNVRKYKKSMKKADITTNQYFKTYNDG